MLELTGIDEYRYFEDYGIYVAHINRDKILILTEISLPEELREIAEYLPNIIDEMTVWINAPENYKLADERRVPIAKFLWDLYLVGFHQVTKTEGRFRAVEVSDVQRDRFVARKIVIEYESEEEKEELFTKYLLPHRFLDLKIDSKGAGYNPEDLKEVEDFLKELYNFLGEEGED